MLLKRTILKNGLTIVSEENETAKVCTLAYLIKSGSFNESEDETGIAHLVEHLLFKGTINRTYKQVNNDIEGIGGILNAETNFQYTKYYCTVPFDKWNIGLDVLSDIIFNHTIPEDEFIKEKKVVQEELKMYNDDPQSYVYDQLIKNMFINYPNRQSIGGTVQDIEKITRNDVLDFINRNYFPENMIIIATGNIQHEKVVSFIEEYINKLNINFTAYQSNYKQFTDKGNIEKLKTYTRDNVEQTHIAFGLFGPSHNSEDSIPVELLSTILGGNSSSVLFDTIREQKGLAYTICLDTEDLNDVSLILGYAGLNRNSDVITEILNILENTDLYLTEEKLSSAKAYLIGMLYLSVEKTSGINNFLANQLLYNDSDTIDILCNKINDVTLEDIQRVAKKYFIKDNIYFSKLN